MARHWHERAGALLLLITSALIPAATAQEARAMMASDFSTVTTRAVAEELVRQGRLVRVRLYPAGPGGTDDPRNIGYVPPEAETAGRRLIGTLERLLEEDLIDQIEVVPEYRNESIIPSRIRYLGQHGRGGAPFEARVEIW